MSKKRGYAEDAAISGLPVRVGRSGLPLGLRRAAGGKVDEWRVVAHTPAARKRRGLPPGMRLSEQERRELAGRVRRKRNRARGITEV